jgi:diaminopimelate epimerase
MVFSYIQIFNITLTLMKIVFNKYQGAGNDFVIIDNRSGIFNPENHKLIRTLCDRRFGIGADGLILIGSIDNFDFEMKYFNSDGFEGSMCGNGGRCSSAFAIANGIAGNNLVFRAVDGIHKAVYENGIINLGMNNVKGAQIIGNNYFLNTGSPHYVVFRDNIDSVDVNAEGRKIRWSDEFKPGGTNVNFVEIIDNGIKVRTFERGVEEETLSCGTGVTASAIASVLSGHFDSGPVSVNTRGGNLSVSFTVTGEEITDTVLSGPATFVFKGEVEI